MDRPVDQTAARGHKRHSVVSAAPQDRRAGHSTLAWQGSPGLAITSSHPFLTVGADADPRSSWAPLCAVHTQGLAAHTLLHGGPAGLGGVAVLWEARCAVEVAPVGAVGIITVEGARRRGHLVGPGGCVVTPVHLTLQEHKAKR